ncbi:hypothetical protein GCM10017691_46580 [Pseudonocardia petroleophila]|uniref:Type-5 uracil-DNA glycosylase n=1 Tax=Pseudonocardia petroleophila TaxID=37331 RepID=A0A7G7MQS4_9PSEU|nr:uracil-DNA glycosylase [Pseudonocardia petroleophila]QNG55135.1 uracil-DNA glycosylase [Pseudonocardia petroleophila]
MTDEVSAVARAIVSCTRCPRLVAWRTETAGPAGVGSPVAGFGDPQAGVFLLGMATAAAGGNCTGRAFTGNRSARTLVAALHRAGFANQPTSEHVGDGLRLDRAWMASAVRCPPPGNRPLAAERDACLGHLRAELAALGRVRVVVCLGVFAWDAALRCVDADPRPRFRHGREHVGPDGLVVLGCYHPSPQNTATGLLTPPMLDAVLHRARELMV